MLVTNDPRFNNAEPESYRWENVTDTEISEWAIGMRGIILRFLGIASPSSKWVYEIEGLRMSLRLMARYAEVPDTTDSVGHIPARIWRRLERLLSRL